jgi:tetratricopeptide (TPR) repeat protein
LWGQLYRGFESLPLRQNFLQIGEISPICKKLEDQPGDTMRFLFAAALAAAFTLSWAAPSLADLCYDYVEARQYDEAIEQCTKQYDNAQTNRNRAIILNNRGNAYYYKGQYDRAIEDYNNAIELNPNYTHAYYNRGLAYYQKVQYDRAIEDYNNAIELNPNYTHAYNNRGNAYYQKVQYDRAIEDYDKAIELNPNYTYAYNNRGNAYYGKGQYDRAIEDCNKVIQFDPNDASAYYNIACLYSVQNNTAEACQWLKKAVEKGYNKWTHIKEDNDLDNIRKSACYMEIMAGKGKIGARETTSPDDLTKQYDQ